MDWVAVTVRFTREGVPVADYRDKVRWSDEEGPDTKGFWRRMADSPPPDWGGPVDWPGYVIILRCLHEPRLRQSCLLATLTSGEVVITVPLAEVVQWC